MVGRKTPFFKCARKEGIDLTNIESNLSDENYCKNIDGKEKISAINSMVRKRVPLQLWCYTLEYYCYLITMIITGMFRNKVRTGYNIIFGNTPDISE